MVRPTKSMQSTLAAARPEAAARLAAPVAVAPVDPGEDSEALLEWARPDEEAQRLEEWLLLE